MAESAADRASVSATDIAGQAGTMSPEEEAVRLLTEAGLKLTAAESCTGGMLAMRITSVSGASAVFPGSFVTYSVREKHRMVGVSSSLLKRQGAVSRRTALRMAEGAARQTGAHYAMSVTGNAGPEPSEGKPVGLVYTALAVRGEGTTAEEHHFTGDRESIRRQACDAALAMLVRALRRSGDAAGTGTGRAAAREGDQEDKRR